MKFHLIFSSFLFFFLVLFKILEFISIFSSLPSLMHAVCQFNCLTNLSAAAVLAGWWIEIIQLHHSRCYDSFYSFITRTFCIILARRQEPRLHVSSHSAAKSLQSRCRCTSPFNFESEGKYDDKTQSVCVFVTLYNVVPAKEVELL